MIKSLSIALVFGLAIPIVGYLISNAILVDINSEWANFGPDFKVESFCSKSISELEGEIKSGCQEIIYINLLRTASIWAGTVFVGLLSLYFFSSIACGTNRALIARVFPILVPITSFVVALLIFVQGAILTYAAWQGESYAIGRVHYMLIGAIALGALLGGFKLLGALFSFKTKAETTIAGKVLKEQEALELWGFVDAIATKLGAKKPDNIIVGLEPTFYVTSADVNVSSEQTTLKGESLYLSLPLMRLFQKDELAAVVGHELGHFRGNDTAYSLKFAPVYAGLANSIQSLKEGDSSFVTLPAVATLTAMFEIFSRNEKKISRIREFEADKAGTSVSSQEGLAFSLAKVAIYSSNWQQIRAENVERLNNGKVTKNLSIVFEDSAKFDVSHSSIDEIVQKILPAQITHPTDTHPSIKDRYENISFNISNLKISSLIETGNSSEFLLGENLEAIEEELTLFEHRLMVAVGYVSPQKQEEQEQSSALLNAIYVLAATMVGADGKIEQSEVKMAEAIGKKLIKSFDEVEFRSICKSIDELPKFENIVELLGNAFGQEQLQTIYEFLKEIASADGEIAEEEEKLLLIARKQFEL